MKKIFPILAVLGSAAALIAYKMKKEEEKLHKEIARADGMLKNPNVVSKAPEAKIQAERDKLEKYTQMLKQVKERLEALIG